ncbi:MAG: transglutaminase family protein [Jatrophihabitans sp.]|uniref:transglutaminase family protein n=1 Tax=Jatrophihabitans sp. TaxID=1932789 RepID=UPI003F7ED7DA
MSGPVRYSITHTSHYAYDHAVGASFNETRLTPKLVPWQAPLDFNLQVEPVTYQHRYVDYWGTQVRIVEATQPHRSLDIRATSVVEINASRREPADALGWDVVRAASVADRWCEFLAPTRLTEVPDDLAARAEELAGTHSPDAAAREISATVHDALTYRSGVTQVQSPASEAWASRVGVCQDYAHLVVGALRHVGLPARYVSGYLYPSHDPDVGESAEGESHAWVEWWLGRWVAFDPTNLIEVANRHVLVGTGRDYADVPPIKGIVAGGHSSTDLTVRVDLHRVA